MKKLSIIVLFLLLPVIFTGKVPKREIVIEDTDLQFINTWLSQNKKEAYFGKLFTVNRLLLVLEYSRENAIPASVILSQMLLESRSGSGMRIATHVEYTNNYFGIKYGKFKNINTKRYSVHAKEHRKGVTKFVNVSFSIFESFEDCLRAYIIIVNKCKIDGLFDLKCMTKRYATSPKYLQLINRVIRTNNFKDFDRQVSLSQNNQQWKY